MARALAITYNGFTIGGSSTTTEPLEWSIDVRPDGGEVSCTFVLYAASAAAFATARTAAGDLVAEDGALTVKVNATTIESFDPAAATLTCYKAVGELEKTTDQPDSVFASTYRFRVRFKRPATVDDGQRDGSYRVVSGLQNRRAVTFSGTWTAVPGTGARAQFAAQIAGYTATTLTAIDAAATWQEVDREVTPNDTDSEATYSITYWEVVTGRRESKVRVSISPNGRKTVTISGTYVKTGANSATTNYTTNENTHSAAVLTTVTGTYDEPVESYDYNEQNETLSFERVYEELLHNQKAGTVDDDEVTKDRLSFAATAATPGGTPGENAKSLTEIVVTYEAWVLRTVAPATKWTGNLKAHLLAQVATQLNLTAVALDSEAIEVDPVENRLIARLTLKALASSVVTHQVEDTIDDDFGKSFTAIANGSPHSYLRQQRPPRRTKVRRTTVVFSGGKLAGTSIDDYFSGDHDGFVLVRRSRPVIETEIGASPSVILTSLSLTEEFLYVRSEVKRGASGSVSPSASPSASGGLSVGAPVSYEGAVPADQLRGRGGRGADVSGFSIGIAADRL